MLLSSLLDHFDYVLPWNSLWVYVIETTSTPKSASQPQRALALNIYAKKKHHLKHDANGEKAREKCEVPFRVCLVHGTGQCTQCTEPSHSQGNSQVTRKERQAIPSSYIPIHAPTHTDQ